LRQRAGLSTAAELSHPRGHGRVAAAIDLFTGQIAAFLWRRKWQALDTGEANALYAELLNKPHSLVGDLHLIRLAGLRDSPEFWAQAELVRLGPELDPPGASQFNSFRALLRFAESQFFRWG